MHVGRTALSKDMMEAQKLIAQASKQEKAQPADSARGRPRQHLLYITAVSHTNLFFTQFLQRLVISKLKLQNTNFTYTQTT